MTPFTSPERLWRSSLPRPCVPRGFAGEGATRHMSLATLPACGERCRTRVTPMATDCASPPRANDVIPVAEARASQPSQLISFLVSEARFEGLPVRCSALSALAIACSAKFTPSQRSGSGSQEGERCSTHGSRTRGLSSPRIRSASGTTGKVARRHPVANIPSRPGVPALLVIANGAAPVSGNADGPTPAVRYRSPRYRRKQPDEIRIELVKDVRLALERVMDT